VNEKPDEIIEMPNITLTSDTTIKELGKVENIVDNVVLVTTKLSGEYQVLETSSVLCLEDKTLIGVVAEALGRVEQPFYSVRFTNAVAVYDAGISKGTTIFYVPQYSTFVLTEALKAMKGSDASNIHDEEIRAEELEFSDDEAEAEHKRKQKILRQANRGGRETFGDGFSRQPRQREQAVQSNGDTNREIAGLNYDDVGNEDDFYTPPARSFNLHEQTPDGLGTSDPRRVDYNRGWHGRHDRCEQSSAYRDCGQGRGRGGLGRVGGNGRDSVRRRGGHLHQSQPPLDFSLPPIPKLVSSTKSPEPFAPSPSFHLQQHFAYPHQQPLQNPQRLFYDQGQYSTDQSHSQSYPYSQSPMQAYSAQYQQHHSYVHATTENPSNGGQYLPQHSVNLNFQSQQVPQPQSSSTLPPGAFVNPAFVSGSSNSPMVQQYPYSFQNPYPKQYFPSR
jgi:H/ACA ribonucleoprotein complex non-core subunit NAF1